MSQFKKHVKSNIDRLYLLSDDYKAILEYYNEKECKRVFNVRSVTFHGDITYTIEYKSLNVNSKDARMGNYTTTTPIVCLGSVGGRPPTKDTLDFMSDVRVHRKVYFEEFNKKPEKEKEKHDDDLPEELSFLGAYVK